MSVLAPTVVVGIDPGSRKMGYGILAYQGGTISYISSGCIQSRQGALAPLFEKLQTILEQFKPQQAAIEEVFFHQNPKSALVLGQARGIALLALERAKVPIQGYAARAVKQSVTGYGAATKSDMQHMIQKLLALSHLPGPDEADALGITLCHIHHLQYHDRLSQRKNY